MPDQRDQPNRQEVFVLGAGFSKALYEGMPLMNELNEIVKDRFGQDPLLADQRIQRFIKNNDFEMLLSYLSSDAPWKTPSEYWSDKALFRRIADLIALEIMSRETSGLVPSSMPIWLQKLVIYFDWHKVNVITFNYDTIVERAAWFPKSTFEGERRSFARNICGCNLYPPIMQDVERTGRNPLGRITFKMTKLHGSINWFYSGTDAFPGEQVSFVEVQKDDPFRDYERLAPYLQGKQRLIIPPVSDKTTFYTNFLVRTLWKRAKDALSEAHKVFFIGYSLPVTDLTTHQLLLSTVKPEAEIYIVSKGHPDEKEKLIQRYKDALPQITNEVQFKLDFITENPLQDLAWELLGTDPQAYNQNPSAAGRTDEDLTRIWQRRA